MLTTQSPYHQPVLSLGFDFRHKKPLVAMKTKMQVPYVLDKGQTRYFHQLPSGLKMEVISQKGHQNDTFGKPRPPLVFVHGSFHAAWCWAPHWLPFFSEFGYDCYALSLLGQGESDVPQGPAAGTLQTHASNIADFILKEFRLPPVLIGHSFGGLIVQNYISDMALSHEIHNQSKCDNIHPALTGAVLVCSVPPSGNSGLVWRYLLSKPVAAFKVTLSLAAKAFATSLPLCKETFFSPGIEDDLVKRYQELMKGSSKVPLFDLRKLNATLPSPPVSGDVLEVLVLGASDDFIVDAEGLNETARHYGVRPVCVEGVAHDMMLDVSWKKGARVILSWLNSLNRVEC
ncbi:hypothetical protein H6P81_010153 [Aristolochia fimbriata]|uniref:AB hydrolase-1 domain-containing protein n=1 Tax=Aristolochia fimbriata TaxID=158543 RepID=A0AAV7EMX4_ARIFI|nr:hypothetical protein H6P81_010153 [Aristolochia fimbriata]